MAATSTFGGTSFTTYDAANKSLADMKSPQENPNQRIGTNSAQGSNENIWNYIRLLQNAEKNK